MEFASFFGYSSGNTLRSQIVYSGVMPMTYREEKATQAAARLLKARGGKMSYLKLLKLLYFADRIALVKLGRPITFDKYYSMENGPVLSQTCDLIRDKAPSSLGRYWKKFIEKSGFDVRLTKRAPNDQLSEAEEEILDKVFKKYGRMNRWDIVELAHKLPEYVDPGTSALPLSYADILEAAGVDKAEARAIIAELAAEESFQGAG
jgi:uncharacterized phage-associated protein